MTALLGVEIGAGGPGGSAAVAAIDAAAREIEDFEESRGFEGRDLVGSQVVEELASAERPRREERDDGPARPDRRGPATEDAMRDQSPTAALGGQTDRQAEEAAEQIEENEVEFGAERGDAPREARADDQDDVDARAREEVESRVDGEFGADVDARERRNEGAANDGEREARESERVERAVEQAAVEPREAPASERSDERARARDEDRNARTTSAFGGISGAEFAGAANTGSNVR